VEGRALSRFFPRENLLFYCEFAGLDAHPASWQKTAAYRMLAETTLGAMLEQVAAQLLEKAVSLDPNHKVSGADVVTLVKHATHAGWALAVHVAPGAGGSTPAGALPPIRVSLVVRGVTGKDLRPLTSRLLGWAMGSDAKPHIERKEGRPIVIVPHAQPAGGTGSAGETAWAWWPEKDDLVVAAPYPAGPEAVLAAIDGKAPTAAEHAIVQELGKSEGSFDPVCVMFLDVAHCPKTSMKMTEFVNDLGSTGGIQRIDYRWGFDDDTLMDVTRIVAPKPRKPMLALFDQPGFDTKSLLPMPDGVESFLALSLNTSQLVDAIAALAPAAEVKGKLEEFSESIQGAGNVDVQKDLIGRLGPRMVLYVAPGRSAAAGDESFDTSWLNGMNPTMALSALARLPKITLVAEVDDPVKFGYALDATVNALNKELKVQAMEMANQEQAGQQNPAGPGAMDAGRGPGMRPGIGSGRAPRRRSLAATAAPQFELSPGSVKAYMLRTPTDSALRPPPGFRPVIRMDGKYVAVSVAPDGADAALKAVKRTDWKASEDIARACQRLPSKLIVLGMADPRDQLAPFLASMPGTLQTMINTAITVARNRITGATTVAGGGANPAGGPPPGFGGGSGRMAMGGAARRFAKREMGPDDADGGGQGGPPARARGGFSGGASGFSGAPGGESGAQGPGGTASPGSAADAMVELKVESDKLPKADDLRARMFLTSLSVAVSDQDIRLITREAFPNLFNWSVAGVSVAAGRAAANQMRQAQAQGAGTGPEAAVGMPPGGAGQFGGASGGPPSGYGAGMRRGGPVSAAPAGGRPGGPATAPPAGGGATTGRSDD
jgi:hypothetical protein